MPHNSSGLVEIPFSALRVKDWLIIGWAMLWRNLVILLAVAVCSFMLGAMIGVVLAVISTLAHVPVKSILPPVKIASFGLGMAIGFLFLIVQIKWFFRAKFRKFRIILVDPASRQEPESTEAPPAVETPEMNT